jgi:hypothetical protein
MANLNIILSLNLMLEVADDDAAKTRAHPPTVQYRRHRLRGPLAVAFLYIYIYIYNL